jgi:hypothetical protein
MSKYTKGTVNFDPLIVLGKDFLHGPYKSATTAFEYAFEVKPFLSKAKQKKGEPEKYDYTWSGHFNLIMNSIRIHLHQPADDHGLVDQEQKLNMAKEKLDFFLKEIKTRYKTPAKGSMQERHWLNKLDSGYTGYVALNIDENGGGTFSIADCHKTIIYWCDVWLDPLGKPMKSDDARTNTIKSLEGLSKGLGRAIKAIQELRKFFERELESTSD